MGFKIIEDKPKPKIAAKSPQKTTKTPRTNTTKLKKEIEDLKKQVEYYKNYYDPRLLEIVIDNYILSYRSAYNKQKDNPRSKVKKDYELIEQIKVLK